MKKGELRELYQMMFPESHQAHRQKPTHQISAP